MSEKTKKFTNEQYGLWFDVRRSSRYHERRWAFFSRLHQITGGLTILLAGSVIFDIARPGDNPWWLLTISFVAACLAAWDIVVGYAARAGVHHSLRARWCALELEMLKGNTDEATWDAYEIKRREIEADEPPIYRALDLLCNNEMLIADGHNRKLAEVSRWQRFTSQIFLWQNISQNSQKND